jgi:hypothetical protein
VLALACVACAELVPGPTSSTSLAMDATTTISAQPATTAQAVAGPSIASTTTTPVTTAATTLVTTATTTPAATTTTLRLTSASVDFTGLTTTTTMGLTEVSLLDLGVLDAQLWKQDVQEALDAPLSPKEMTAIEGAVKLTFECDPTASQAPPGQLSPLKRRTYEVLRLMRALEFSEPLPWTDQTLWHWFIASVDEIRFIKYEAGNPNPQFADGPEGRVIYVPTSMNIYLCQTDLFIDPQHGNGGLMDSLVLFVHEARHQQKFHSAGPGPGMTLDKTILELGAWGVQYYMYLFLADYSNFRISDHAGQELYKRAEGIKSHYFTEES